jgi:hypothetical protein
MEHLSDARQRVLRTAIAAGRVPRHTNARVVLTTGAGPRGSYVVLANHRGLTKHGEAYYAETGLEAPDRRFDMSQQPTRQGDSEFVRDRGGNLVRLRTLRPDGSFVYTAAGKHFFSRRQVEYVVHVPVIVRGRRRNGNQYAHSTYLPASLLGVHRIMADAALSPARRAAAVRSFVLQSLQLRTEGGQTVLLEISGEVYYYDRDREWLLDEMTTEPTAHGPRVDVRARVVMAGPVSAAAFVPYADQVLDAAWETHDDKLCVIRQLAVLLEQREEDLCDEFDRLLQREWRHEGLDTDDVLLYCKEHALPYYCLHAGRIRAWMPLAPAGKAVAFCAFGGHLLVGFRYKLFL